MIEAILISSITVLTSAIATYIVGKRLVNSSFDAKFDEILDYLASPEGQQSVMNLGTIFAAGLRRGIGLEKLKRGGKILGFPSEVVIPILEKIVGKIGDKAISGEQQSSSASDSFG